jgi:hypothetical protein
LHLSNTLACGQEILTPSGRFEAVRSPGFIRNQDGLFGETPLACGGLRTTCHGSSQTPGLHLTFIFEMLLCPHVLKEIAVR